MRWRLATFVAVVVMAASCAKADGTSAGTPPAAEQKPQTAAEKAKPAAAELQTAAEHQGFGDFDDRIQAYLEFHKRVASKAPKLPTEATPEQIDAHQRALAKMIATERAGAKRGDIFTPEAAKAIKAVLARVFGGPDGKRLRSSIMDENPVGAKYQVAVNGRYPDEVPMSTVPPQVLASLPKLPKELEYRFVDDRLILLDVPAHIIVDFIDNALP